MPPSTTRRRILRATAASGLLAAAPALTTPTSDTDWQALAADVKAEMVFAWQGYKARAWGHDQVKPVSGGHEEFFFPGQPMGLSIVEALDTLWLMGLDAEFEEGLDWVRRKSALRHRRRDPAVRVFDPPLWADCWPRTTPAAMRGFSRWLEDLASRLVPAFERSPTGMPYRFVNLRTGAVRRDPVTFRGRGGQLSARVGNAGEADRGAPLLRPAQGGGEGHVRPALRRSACWRTRSTWRAVNG